MEVKAGLIAMASACGTGVHPKIERIGAKVRSLRMRRSGLVNYRQEVMACDLYHMAFRSRP